MCCHSNNKDDDFFTINHNTQTHFTIPIALSPYILLNTFPYHYYLYFALSPAQHIQIHTFLHPICSLPCAAHNSTPISSSYLLSPLHNTYQFTHFLILFALSPAQISAEELAEQAAKRDAERRKHEASREQHAAMIYEDERLRARVNAILAVGQR
jgi:hypothetical protein